MTLTNLFQIDGKSLYAPDCDIEPSYSDLDSSDSGRDEAGYMHREVVREKVATWPIAYSCLTDDEYKYTIGLFAGKATFQFTHPKAGSSTETETTTCYCSKYGIAWHNAKGSPLSAAVHQVAARSPGLRPSPEPRQFFESYILHS